ncbi:MAG TPA: hypothetical protein VEB40_12155 [Flavipsychrobacter sp.]|nr:hypothetical protein [Flavipsychrobacter sp.]
MSKPQCPKCGGTTFTARPVPVENLNMEIAFITCKSCNAAIGTLNITDTNRLKGLSDRFRTPG